MTADPTKRPPRPPVAAFLFDCDGTLVDSEGIGIRALHAVGQRYGSTIAAQDFHERTYGRHMAQVIEVLNAHSPTAMPAQYADLARAYQTELFRSELKEIEGARALLSHLARHCIPFAVVTNAPRNKVELTLGITQLLPLVAPEHIFSAYEHDAFKPDPKLFLLAAQALGVSPSNCAVVEDSPSGLRAGVAARMQVFSLLPKAQTPADLLDEPITYIARLNELRMWLPPGAQ